MKKKHLSSFPIFVVVAKVLVAKADDLQFFFLGSVGLQSVSTFSSHLSIPFWLIFTTSTTLEVSILYVVEQLFPTLHSFDSFPVAFLKNKNTTNSYL